MLRAFEARCTDQIKFFERLQSDDPEHGYYTWLPGLEKYPKFTDTWRGWGNRRYYDAALGIDGDPHSGYPNELGVFLTYTFYLDWPLDGGCREYIWCLGAAKDRSGGTPNGTKLIHVTDGSHTPGQGKYWSNTYFSLYLDFPNRYNIYMLNYSLAERMKMLIDPNYKPTYK